MAFNCTHQLESHGENYKPPSRGQTLLVIETTMISITILVVFLRLFTRVHILGAVHSDDWWILLASAFLICLTAAHGVGVKYGIGKHTCDLSKDSSDLALTMSYVGQLFYVASLGCVKISLLLFLQRIFPTVVFRRLIRGILIFVLCFTVTNVFLFAFQCDTPDYYFTKITGGNAAESIGGTCLAPQAVYYPMAAVNILTDTVIWLVPLRPVIKASLPRREKMGLLWVFALGGVAVGASIVRPLNLRDIMEDGDPTWSMVNTSIWAMVEISLGILCASIPAIKPLVLRVAPCLLQSTSISQDRSQTEARINSFPLRSIKVTHDIHQVEDDVTELASMRVYGMQQPVMCQSETGKVIFTDHDNPVLVPVPLQSQTFESNEKLVGGNSAIEEMNEKKSYDSSSAC